MRSTMCTNRLTLVEKIKQPYKKLSEKMLPTVYEVGFLRK